MSPTDVSGQPPKRVRLITTMGTVVSIDVRTDVERQQFDQATREVADRLRLIDEMFSPWKADSWVSQLIDGRASPPACPPDIRRILELSRDLNELTSGYFSPFWRPITITETGPDPTGLVKGWAAQQASDILLHHRMPDHVVNAAGDLVLSGAATTSEPQCRAWRVGITGPVGSENLAGVIELDSTSSRWAVATSGTAELGDHIIDPHTGIAARMIASATAVARLEEISEAGAVVDACATALVAAGDQAGILIDRLAHDRVYAFVIGVDGNVHDPHGLLVTPQ